MNKVALYKTLPKDFLSQVSVATGWIRCGSEFLFLQRDLKSKYSSLWAVPGGKIKDYETPLQGMVREILLEKSIDLKEKTIKDL